MSKKYQLIHVGFGSFTDERTGEVKDFASGFFVDVRKITHHSDNDRSEVGFKVHKLNIVKDDGSFEPDLILAKKFFDYRLAYSISHPDSMSAPVVVDVDIDMTKKDAKASICGLLSDSPKKS